MDKWLLIVIALINLYTAWINNKTAKMNRDAKKEKDANRGNGEHPNEK